MPALLYQAQDWNAAAMLTHNCVWNVLRAGSTNSFYTQINFCSLTSVEIFFFYTKASEAAKLSVDVKCGLV